MIKSPKRWRFSQYVLPHDGTRVITEWINGLDERVQAEFDARFATFAAHDKWHDMYKGADELDALGEKFEGFTKVREIAVTVSGVLYRILGVHVDVWEFVMLIGYADSRRRSRIPRDVRTAFEERLTNLRKHPENRCDYDFE